MSVFRLLVKSEDRISGNPYDFIYSITDFSSLNTFSQKTLYYAVEWTSIVEMSEYSIDYSVVDPRHPTALMLESLSMPQGNSYCSWDKNASTALCLLPGYRQTAIYGKQEDSPYIRNKTLGGVTRSDDLARRGELRFRLNRCPDPANTFEPAYANDFSFSMVWWCMEPEKPLTPYDHFHVWLASADRTSGTVDDFTVQVNLTTFSIESGNWMLAVSYLSPIVDDNVGVSPGIIVDCPTFVQSPFCATNTIAYAGRDDKYYGYRTTIKPATSDTIGIPIGPLRNNIDRVGEIKLRLLNSATREPVNGALLLDYVVCLTFFRSK